MAGVPEVLSAMPDVLKNIFGSPITIGAFSAILLNLFLPREPSGIDVFDPTGWSRMPSAPIRCR